MRLVRNRERAGKGGKRSKTVTCVLLPPIGALVRSESAGEFARRVGERSRDPVGTAISRTRSAAGRAAGDRRRSRCWRTPGWLGGGRSNKKQKDQCPAHPGRDDEETEMRNTEHPNVERKDKVIHAKGCVQQTGHAAFSKMTKWEKKRPLQNIAKCRRQPATISIRWLPLIACTSLTGGWLW